MQSGGTKPDVRELFVDGHVHIYPFMSVQVLLNAASRNLFKDSVSLGGGTGLLIVADPDGVHGYERLLHHNSERYDLDEQTHWQCAGGDSRSVTLRRSSGESLIAIRGQQLITREGLEVLGVGYDNDLPSGLTLVKIIDRIWAAGGWSIIAWGAGKWLGRRGRVVSDLIEAEGNRPDIMLADNGGRPWCWSRVPQFETAAERGIRVLAGTDPLPLKGEERRVGSYGFCISVDGTEGQPTIDAFRCALENPEIPIRTIGKRMTVSTFVSNQLRLRLRPLAH